MHIVHGRYDRVCHLYQAEVLVRSLRAVGNSDENYFITTAGHSSLEPETDSRLCAIMNDLPPMSPFDRGDGKHKWNAQQPPERLVVAVETTENSNCLSSVIAPRVPDDRTAKPPIRGGPPTALERGGHPGHSWSRRSGHPSVVGHDLTVGRKRLRCQVLMFNTCHGSVAASFVVATGDSSELMLANSIFVAISRRDWLQAADVRTTRGPGRRSCGCDGRGCRHRRQGTLRRCRTGASSVAGFDFECAGKHDEKLTPGGRVPILIEALGHLRHHRALRRQYRGAVDSIAESVG